MMTHLTESTLDTLVTYQDWALRSSRSNFSSSLHPFPFCHPYIFPHLALLIKLISTIFHENIAGCPNIHKFNLHRHAYGEEHPDGVCLPAREGVLQGALRHWVPGSNLVHGLTESRLWTCVGGFILCICLVHGLTPSVSICTGCGHALGSAGRDDKRAYDHRALHEGARLLSTAFYRSQEKIFG